MDDLRIHCRVVCRFTACWSLLIQAEMGPVPVIIADVFVHEPFQMALIEDNDVVQQIAAAGAHESFGDAILPRAFVTCTNGAQAD